MDKIERARQIRKGVMLNAESYTDEQAASVPSLFSDWESAGHSYSANDRVQYMGLLYKCLTAHTSQESWTPDASPSLWVRIDDPAAEWPAWRQPLGAADAYAKGAKVSHIGKHWISNVDANVWEPPEQWTEA